MRYRILWCLLSPLRRVGLWADRVLQTALSRHRSRKALKPGTKVVIDCECHPGIVWYVDAYHPDADDYKLSRTWPTAEGLRGRVNEDWCYCSMRYMKIVS